MSFDEMYDEMLHDEFRSGSTRGAHAATGPATGFARYRTAALVGAGGMACATAGAFLGGLGGYFTLSPASAHSITSTSESVPLVQAANAAFHDAVTAAPAPAAVAAAVETTTTKTHFTNDAHGAAEATFAAAAGPLLNGIAPLQAPTVTAPVTAPVTGGTSTGGTTPAAPGSVGQVLTIGLTDMLGNLTSALTSLTTLGTNPVGAITGIVTPLTGVLDDVTGTLANLSSLMPLPTGLSTGSLPVVSALAPVLGGLGGGGPVTGGPAHTASVAAPKNTTPSSAASALAPILSSVAAAVTDTTGGGLPSIPSLPLPSGSGAAPALPSLPVTTAAGALPALPVISLPSIPGVVSSSGGTTCVSAPALPALPLPIKTTLHLGPISVGINTAGGSSAATVCATP